MSRIRIATAIALGAFLAPEMAHAQRAAQGRERAQVEVPRQYRPPPGMCRIWVDGVPAARQPAPTDCSTALRDRPVNGRVVFGDSPLRGRNEPLIRAAPPKK